jgi:hypothetical protein
LKKGPLIATNAWTTYNSFGENDSASYWYQKAASFRVAHPAQKLGFDALLRQDYGSAERCFQQLGSTSNDLLKAEAEYSHSLIPIHRMGLVKKWSSRNV